MTPTHVKVAHPLSPMPRLDPRDRAELRRVDDQMMALMVRFSVSGVRLLLRFGIRLSFPHV
jgi:hypothetical protein